MKKISMMMNVFVVLFAFVYGCTTSSSAEQAVTTLNNYLDSVKALKPVYTDSAWSELNNGYEIRLQEAESNSSLTKAENEKIEAAKLKYTALRNEYELNISESKKAVVVSSGTALRNRLFGEGVVGNDMRFTNVTGANLLSTYRNFVTTVEANKNSYTREDWDEIKVLYEALDTRKNEVEKDAPSGDNTKIAALKIKFAALKAANRSSAKAKENQDAKD